MNLPASMRAIEITQYGEPEVLKLGTRSVPQPARGEVLIAMAATGINRADTMQRRGNYPVPPGTTDIPGLELSGTIAALGEGVSDWRIGDEVCARVQGGSYADYCIAPAPQCLRGSLPAADWSSKRRYARQWLGFLRRAERPVCRPAPGRVVRIRG